MVDLKLNSNFEVFIDHTGDLATVSGRDEFEQDLLLRLVEAVRPLLGSVDNRSIKERALVEAQNVAGDSDVVDRIQTFEAEIPEDEPNTLTLRIVYDTGDSELTI